MANSSRPLPHPLQSRPPEAWSPLLRLARIVGSPLERFLQIEAASGILLLLSATLAMLLANSPWGDAYRGLWHTPLGIRVGGFVFERSLEWVVNDGLMVVFFFVVGLEIRREVHDGELSEWRRAAVPAAAALGGMLAPAAIYLSFSTADAHAGWGVPMATDIAFAVGVLALLGKRVPAALRVLLLALAVIDDLGAIVVIALFYSSGVQLSGLLVAGASCLGILVMQRFGVRSRLVYVVPGLVAWAGVYAAGIHPTIAGVVVGLLTPVRAWLGPEGFVLGVSRELEQMQTGSAALSNQELGGSLRQLDAARREALSPAEGLIQALHPWVAFGIMPLFALVNAGVSLQGLSLTGSSWSTAVGVACGLLVGKPLGVLLAVGLCVRLGVGVVPIGIGARHLLVLGVVAGVGFTMALFVAQLAFVDAALLGAAKLGVLLGSAVAGVLALVLGRLLLAPVYVPGSAATVDEAESSTEA